MLTCQTLKIAYFFKRKNSYGRKVIFSRSICKIVFFSFKTMKALLQKRKRKETKKAQCSRVACVRIFALLCFNLMAESTYAIRFKYRRCS